MNTFSAVLGVLRRPNVLLLCVCLFAFFWRLGAAPLFDLDEALYVDCARQMVLSGDWTTPRLNSRPPLHPERSAVAFYEKPIFVYWASAASQRVFGINRPAARLPAAFAALLATGIIAGFGSRCFGHRAGTLAGMVYAACPLTLLDARQMTTDGLLVLWLTAALCLFALPVPTPVRGRPVSFRCKARPYLFWMCCAFAVLTKGAVGLLLPALVLTVFTLAEVAAAEGIRPSSALLRSCLTALWKTLRSLRPLTGLLLFLLIAAPWHLLAARTGERDAQGRNFVQEYVVRQHVNRFRGGAKGDTVHNAPLPSYLAYFLIGFFPWACFVPAALRKDRPSREAEQSPIEPSENAQTEAKTRRFLVAWFGTIFVFFTLGAAKLPTYIAPAYPPAALLVGRWLDGILKAERRDRALQNGAFGALLTGTLLTAVIFFVPPFLPPRVQIPLDALHLAQAVMLTLLLGTLTAWACFRSGGNPSRSNKAGIAALLLTVLTVAGIGCTWGYAFAERDGFGPYQRLAEQANASAAQGLPIVYYHIVPRTPSMLYRADYSPLEHGETPLLPYLRPFLKDAPSHQAIIITSQKTLDTQLRAELDAAPDLFWHIVAQDGHIGGGWLMLRIQQHEKPLSHSH